MLNKIIIFTGVVFILFLSTGCDIQRDDAEFQDKILLKIYSPDEKKFVETDIYVWKDDEFLNKYRSDKIYPTEIPVKIGETLNIIALSDEYPYTDRIIKHTITKSDNSFVMNVYKRSQNIDLDCFYYVGVEDYKRFIPIQEDGNSFPRVTTKDKYTLLSNPFIPVIQNTRIRHTYDESDCFSYYNWLLYTAEEHSFAINYNTLYCSISNKDKNSRFYLDKVKVYSGLFTNTILVDKIEETASSLEKSRLYNLNNVLLTKNITTLIIPRIIYTTYNFDSTSIDFEFIDELPKVLDLSQADYEKYQDVKEQIDIEYPRITINIEKRNDLLWLEQCNIIFPQSCEAFCRNKLGEKYHSFNQKNFEYSGSNCCCFFLKDIDFFGSTIQGKGRDCYSLDGKLVDADNKNSIII